MGRAGVAGGALVAAEEGAEEGQGPVAKAAGGAAADRRAALTDAIEGAHARGAGRR